MVWVKRTAYTLLGIVGICVILLYAGSEWVLRQSHATLIDPIVADRSVAGVAEGARMARIAGCRGCHAPDGRGRILEQSALLGRIAAPALAPRAAKYSDAALAQLIRHGIKQDGTALYIMPTQALTHLSDDDVAQIIGWIRTLKPNAHDLHGTISYGPVARYLILTGVVESKVHEAHVAPPVRPTDVGSYFVHVTCLACHDLHNPKPSDSEPDQIVPALAEVGAAYDPNAFHTLLRTGVGMTRRDLGLMRRVAKSDLHMFSDTEIAAIQAYLIKEQQRPTEQ